MRRGAPGNGRAAADAEIANDGYSQYVNFNFDDNKRQIEGLESRLEGMQSDIFETMGAQPLGGIPDDPIGMQLYVEGANTLQALNGKKRGLQSEIGALRFEGRQAELAQKMLPYSDFLSRPDFGQYSAAAGSKMMQWDSRYDFINDIDNYREVVRNPYATSKINKNGEYGQFDKYIYIYMLSTEVGIYNYLYATEGRKAADKYLDTLGPYLEQRKYAGNEERLAEQSRRYPVAASAFSVAKNLLSGTVALADLGRQNLSRAVTGTPVNYYSPAQFYGQSGSIIRNAVSEDFSELGKKVYNGMMSGWDGVAAFAVGGGHYPWFGPSVAGANAGTQKSRDIWASGGSDDEAFFGGLATGVGTAGAEYGAQWLFKRLKNSGEVDEITRQWYDGDTPRVGNVLDDADEITRRWYDDGERPVAVDGDDVFGEFGGETELVTYRRVQGGSGTKSSQERIVVNSDGTITIYNKNLNISIDDGTHASYFADHVRGENARIVEFDVPKWFDDLLKENAIPQKNYRTNLWNQSGMAPKLTDPTTPGKSFEIPDPWTYWLEEYAVNARYKP